MVRATWFKSIEGEKKEEKLEVNRETLSEMQVKQVRDGIWRFTEDGLHEEVEDLSDDKEKAREQMLHAMLVHELPYQAGNGYDTKKRELNRLDPLNFPGLRAAQDRKGADPFPTSSSGSLYLAVER
ncbi:hypothetical protein AKJ57_01745 [candidate division MSBL1 archaeon SCGC-AAA259A05]|uniref:Uncharacterized protein n=1 Tax=candidate division MSBL1 archaeon SCGC-AAA259A05 TaxID=1698259 RepID=A0A133UAP8_9EURY|nr:hypothetical protein AKJ57_01745 [candidate division MSBL1 archaeon SCGC-AAA259A05]